MGHLSNSENKNDPVNEIQLKKFNDFCLHFPNIKQSLSATPALYLDKKFRKNIARVGYGLIWLLEKKHLCNKTCNVCLQQNNTGKKC